MFVKLLYFLRGTQIAHELWRDILKRETAARYFFEKNKNLRWIGKSLTKFPLHGESSKLDMFEV